MVGTHDNEPISMWADSMINTHEGYLNVVNLVDDMYSELQGKDRDDLIVKLTTDAKALMTLSLQKSLLQKQQMYRCSLQISSESKQLTTHRVHQETKTGR